MSNLHRTSSPSKVHRHKLYLNVESELSGLPDWPPMSSSSRPDNDEDYRGGKGKACVGGQDASTLRRISVDLQVLDDDEDAFRTFAQEEV